MVSNEWIDRIDWTKLLKIVRNVGVNWRERQLIRTLYVGQRVKLRPNQEKTESMEIRGVKQRCCMPPALFNQFN